MPVPGFYNGDGGHGQAAQLDGSQDAVLVLVVQGQQLVRLLHRGLEREFRLFLIGGLEALVQLAQLLGVCVEVVEHMGRRTVHEHICFAHRDMPVHRRVELVVEPGWVRIFQRGVLVLRHMVQQHTGHLVAHIQHGGGPLHKIQVGLVVHLSHHMGDLVGGKHSPVPLRQGLPEIDLPTGGERRGAALVLGPCRIRHNKARHAVVHRRPLLCVGHAALGRFHRVALRPGAHGLGPERRVYSSVSSSSSRKLSANSSNLARSFSVKGLPLSFSAACISSCASCSFSVIFPVLLQRISCCAHCIIAVLALQGLCLPGRRFQGRRQLALCGLGLSLLGPSQLINEGADSVPDLLQQRPVIPVPLDEVIQHLAVVNEAPRIVRRHLVHGLLIGQLHALRGVAVDALLDAVLLLLCHDVPERPVLRGGKLLHPVGHLVAHNSQYRVFIVPFHQHRAAADLGIGRSAAHTVHELHPHAQGLGNSVDLGRRLGGQIDAALTVSVQNGTALLVLQRSAALHGLLHKVVIHETAVLSGHLGILGRLLLPLEGEGRVVLPGGIGCKALGLGQAVAVVAVHLCHVRAVDACLVVRGEACIVFVGANIAVIAGRQGLGPVFAQGGGCVPHAADVIRLLRRRALRGRLLRLRRGGGSFLRIHGNLRLRPCKGLHGAFHGLALLALGHAVLHHLARCLLQGGHSILVRQNTVRRLSADAPVLARLLRRLGQQLIGCRGLGGRFCLLGRGGGLLLGVGFAHVVVVGGRGDNAAHHTGGRAHKEIIQRVLQRFPGAGYVPAINAGHLPLHPVSDELLQALAHRSGPEGQRTAQHTLARVRLCKAVHGGADAPLHGVVQCAAAIGMAEQQGDIEHLLRKDFLCGGGCAVEYLLLQGGVWVVLPGLLRPAAERTHGKSTHTARRSQQGVGCCVERCLGHGSACVHQHLAHAAQPLLGPLNVLGRGLLDVVRQLIAGLGRFLLHLLVQHLCHRVVFPLPVVDDVLLALDVPLVPASGLFLVFRQHGVHVQLGPLQVVGIFRQILPVLRVASALAHGVEDAHGVAVGGQRPLGPASDGVSQAGEEAPLLCGLFRRGLRHGGQFGVFPFQGQPTSLPGLRPPGGGGGRRSSRGGIRPGRLLVLLLLSAAAGPGFPGPGLL